MRSFVRTAKRSWSLVDGTGHVLGTKVQPKWYSQRSEIAVSNGVYLVKSRAMLTTDLAVFFGEVPILIAKQAWRTTVIHEPRTLAPVLVMKRKTWSSRVFNLVDGSGAIRASMCRRFNWKRFEHVFELLEEHGDPLDPLLLLFAAHVIEVQQQRAAAAAG